MDWIKREILVEAISAVKRLEQDLAGGKQAEVLSMRIRLESMLNHEMIREKLSIKPFNKGAGKMANEMTIMIEASLRDARQVEEILRDDPFFKSLEQEATNLWIFKSEDQDEIEDMQEALQASFFQTGLEIEFQIINRRDKFTSRAGDFEIENNEKSLKQIEEEFEAVRAEENKRRKAREK